MTRQIIGYAKKRARLSVLTDESRISSTTTMDSMGRFETTSPTLSATTPSEVADLVSISINLFHLSLTPRLHKQWRFRFCQALCPILPGSLTNFEIGIFLSLHLILCNVRSVGQMITKIRQTAWQNQSDSKNRTNFVCFVYTRG
jgi:hypothetical protein